MDAETIGEILIGIVFVIGLFTIVGWFRGVGKAVIAHQQAKAKAVANADARAEAVAMGGTANVVVAAPNQAAYEQSQAQAATSEQLDRTAQARADYRCHEQTRCR